MFTAFLFCYCINVPLGTIKLTSACSDLPLIGRGGQVTDLTFRPGEPAESLPASDLRELSVMFTSRGGRKLQRRSEHAEVTIKPRGSYECCDNIRIQICGYAGMIIAVLSDLRMWTPSTSVHIQLLMHAISP
jgi:hypothetical protein